MGTWSECFSITIDEQEADKYYSAFVDAITIGGHLLPEPRLSACVLLARTTLSLGDHWLDTIRPRWRKSEHALSTWNSLASRTSAIISCRQASDHFATSASNPFRRLSQLFHLLLPFILQINNLGRRKDLEDPLECERIWELFKVSAERFTGALQNILNRRE